MIFASYIYGSFVTIVIDFLRGCLILACPIVIGRCGRYGSGPSEEPTSHRTVKDKRWQGSDGQGTVATEAFWAIYNSIVLIVSVNLQWIKYGFNPNFDN